MNLPKTVLGIKLKIVFIANRKKSELNELKIIVTRSFKSR